MRMIVPRFCKNLVTISNSLQDTLVHCLLELYNQRERGREKMECVVGPYIFNLRNYYLFTKKHGTLSIKGKSKEI